MKILPRVLFFLFLLFGNSQNLFSNKLSNNPDSILINRLERWISCQTIYYSLDNLPRDYNMGINNSIQALTQEKLTNALKSSEIDYSIKGDSVLQIELKNLIKISGRKIFGNLNTQVSFLLPSNIHTNYIFFEILDSGKINSSEAVIAILLKYSFLSGKGASKCRLSFFNQNKTIFNQVGWNHGLKYYYYELEKVSERKDKNSHLINQSTNDLPITDPPAFKEEYVIKIISPGQFKLNRERYLNAIKDSLYLDIVSYFEDKDKVEVLGYDPIQMKIGLIKGLISKGNRFDYWEELNLAIYDFIPKENDVLTVRGFYCGSYVDISSVKMPKNTFSQRCRPFSHNKLLNDSLRKFYTKYYVEPAVKYFAKMK